MRFKKTREEEVSLGLAPLIDIVFLLLIFFMVTSNFDVISGVRIKLPKVTQRVRDPSKSRVTLVIDESGGFFFEGEKVEAESFKEKLRAIIAVRTLEQLRIQADKAVRHGVVIQAMDIARSVGIDDFAIVAKWEPGDL